MNLLNQLEEIMEQQGFIAKKLMERGDVLTLLCNQSRLLNIEKGTDKIRDFNVVIFYFRKIL
jgi:hypothetical protein